MTCDLVKHRDFTCTFTPTLSQQNLTNIERTGEFETGTQGYRLIPGAQE